MDQVPPWASRPSSYSRQESPRMLRYAPPALTGCAKYSRCNAVTWLGSALSPGSQVPLVGSVSMLYSKHVRRLTTKLREADGEADAFAQARLANIRTVRVFANETLESDRFSQVRRALAKPPRTRPPPADRWGRLLAPRYTLRDPEAVLPGPNHRYSGGGGVS